MKPAFALPVAFLLLLASTSAALGCTSDSDCEYGSVCTGGVCVDGGSSACKAYCADGVAYQTAYSSSSGCTIAGTYPCQYGCAATGPDCATQASTSTSSKTKYCTTKDYSSVYECNIKYPDNMDATTKACIDDCERANSIPMALAVTGTMTSVIIEEDFKSCVVNYCLSGTTTPTDKCSGVTCENSCESGTLYTDGTCDSSTGQCDYTETACPGGCASDGKSCQLSVKGSVFYTDYKWDGSQWNSVKVAMKGVKVSFDYVDSGGASHTIEGQADDNGDFTLSNANALSQAASIDVSVCFEDSGNKLYLTTDSNPSSSYCVYYDRGIKPTDTRLSDFQMDLSSSPKNKGVIDAYGKIYANVLKAVEFKENALKKGGTVKERVTVYSANGVWHSGEQFSGSTGMFITSAGSGFNLFEAPTNREFHEYCHHIQDENSRDMHIPPGQDHAGYYVNPTSEWGLGEGWAEYCALEMKKYYGLGTKGDYEVGNEMWNLELNYKIDSKKQPATSEELAIAGILLDLRDSTSDYGGHDDDFVTLPLSDIWASFSRKMDFGDGQGQRYVRTLRDLYLSFNASGDTYLLQPFSQGSNQSRLDHVFIMHNAYQDLNNNSRWDEGEPVGYSGKGSSLREDLTNEPGTIVLVDVRDANGNQVETPFVHVSVQFDSPDDYLSYEYDIPVVNGSTALPMPPEEYNATITITAEQAGTGNLATSSFTTTTKEIYDKIDPEKPFGSYSATIALSSVSCQSDLQCEYAGNDDTCVSGTCQPAGTAPQPGPEPAPECCGSGFVLAFALAATLVLVSDRRK